MIARCIRACCVACELQRCTALRVSCSVARNAVVVVGTAHVGTTHVGTAQAGTAQVGTAQVGNGVIAGSGARAEQRRLFAQSRVLAAQRSPVKARQVQPAPRRHVCAGTAIRHGSMRSRGTQGVLEYCGWDVRVACRSAAAQVRRGDRRLLFGTRAVPVEHDGAAAARGRRQRTHARTGRCSVGYSQ